jgi:hypothetical protein
VGSPAKPLRHDEHVRKFRRCWQYGGQQLPPGNAERLLDMVEHLEDVEDVSALCRLLVP